MSSRIIKKRIEVDASPDKVWQVFTDPVVTRQMGGEYVSNWEVGGAIGWKGADGNRYTNGKILQLDQEKLIKHSLLSLDNNDILLSVITYEFEKSDSGTVINATEEISRDMTDEQFRDTNEGWDFALQSVKDIAERL
jgi:uncharacterized protein YndB with AHSA1/START domain